MNHYYPVFCVASRILKQEPYEDLDSAWERAHEHYQEFLDSEFNVSTKSELDCIHAYMDKVYSSTPPSTIVVDVAYYTNKYGVRQFDVEGMTYEFKCKLHNLIT